MFNDIKRLISFDNVEEVINALDILISYLSKFKKEEETHPDYSNLDYGEIKKLYEQYGVRYIAELILSIAKSYTPVRTGRLRDSGQIVVNESTNKASVIFGAGLSYGVYVHEILGNRHPTGRAKYLEDAAYQVANLSQVGDKPLFTFEMILEENLVICNINTIDTESFMNNLNQRNALYNVEEDDRFIRNLLSLGGGIIGR